MGGELSRGMAGRKRAATSDGVARFSFDDLCRRPLGAADFLAIAHRFHSVLIDHIRVMSADQRNEAKRFITLIDTLYDERVKLIASSDGDFGRQVARFHAFDQAQIAGQA